MTAPGPALDLPADIWAIVFAASRPADKAALRQTCSSARQGALVACRSAVLWDPGTRDASGDPTGQEMLRLSRRMPRLRSVYFVSHTRQAFVEATDALSAVAAERKMCLRARGHVQDGDGRWSHCSSLAQMREGGTRTCGAYMAYVEFVDV